ncbi:uncharacterized protein troap [Embiotoca jacksoni]|uniref:uncharacterized protein troap n=1 Tax=Embiotoca jacksoni TaxID=100190 RepID=UPI0037045575
MDSSPVLGQQSRNKIRSDCLRMKNEQNKKHVDKKPSKLQPAPHTSSKDSENKHPGSLEIGRKATVRPGVSRLPVPIKSLRLQTPCDFSQSHCKWEEKPLAGKARKKKPCTRPVPFNLSQPKSTRAVTENQQPLTVAQSRTGTRAIQPENNVCNGKPSKHPAVSNIGGDSSKSLGKSHGKTKEKASNLSGQSGTFSTFKTSAPLSNPLSSISLKHHNTALSAEVCLDNKNPLSLKDPSKISHGSQTTNLTTQGNPIKGLTGEKFQADHKALLSILQNEGVIVSGLASATRQSKAYNYLPQRVSVMKSQQKAGPTSGSVKSVQFSPDPAALQTILQNEGVKAEGVVGATPRNSVCPTGRGTSIYTVLRVPVRKNQAAGAPAVVALKETPLKTWTPQRVRDTRHKPMSSMKWHLSTQQSPYCTPGLKSCKSNLQPHQEQEVVQRLFDDQEDGQNLNGTDKDTETQAEQLPVQTAATKPHCEEKVEETSRTNDDDDDDDDDEEEELKSMGGQIFLQAPHRESVIFFSTGKKLFRAQHFKKQGSSEQHHQDGPASSAQRKVLLAHDEGPTESEPSRQINSSVQHLHRDLIVQNTRSLSPAVAMLCKRLPPLEELRLDEEVSTYMSVCVPAPPGFLPPRPRCGNPLASILHFEESTKFVPIGFDLSSGLSSLHCSPLEEK